MNGVREELENNEAVDYVYRVARSTQSHPSDVARVLISLTAIEREKVGTLDVADSAKAWLNCRGKWRRLSPPEDILAQRDVLEWMAAHSAEQ